MGHYFSATRARDSHRSADARWWDKLRTCVGGSAKLTMIGWSFAYLASTCQLLRPFADDGKGEEGEEGGGEKGLESLRHLKTRGSHTIIELPAHPLYFLNSAYFKRG